MAVWLLIKGMRQSFKDKHLSSHLHASSLWRGRGGGGAEERKGEHAKLTVTIITIH